MPELSQVDTERNPFMEKLDLAALEHAFDEALIEGQAFALELFLAEDWTLIDPFGGLMDRSSFLNAIWSGELKFHSIVTEEIRARIYHQSAVVTGCATMHYESQGRSEERRYRFTHVYHKSKGVWRMVAAQGTPVQDDF